MKDINALHAQAMEYADNAFIARRHGNTAQYEELTRKALDLEREAAECIRDEIEAEPTRSVLYRSAASLAIECGMTREAERLISIALAGNPPEEIANELRDLLEEVHFVRHFDLRGIALNRTEVQMSLAGKAVSSGVALAASLTMRLENAQKLIHRTAERLLEIPFRDSGGPSKSIRDMYPLFVQAPRLGSFAVTLKVGSPQIELPGFTNQTPSEKIVDEILECLELYSDQKDEELETHFGEGEEQKAYLHNFIALARQLSPDGEQISSVHFVSPSQDGSERRISLRRQRDFSSDDYYAKLNEGQKNTETLLLRGQLLFAHSQKKQGAIHIADERTGIEHTIIVPRELMADIVRPLYELTVEAQVARIGKKLHLVNVALADQ